MQYQSILHVSGGPYRPVCTGSIVDRYVDRPLPGGTAKIGRRRSICGEIDRRLSIEEVKGKRRKKTKKKAEEEEKNKYLTRAPLSPAGDFSPCVGREIKA
ncbi:hypothetical protein BHM03_00062486, partial [Ensete ventricosum]